MIDARPLTTQSDNGELTPHMRRYFEMRRRQIIAELNELDDLLGFARTIQAKGERYQERRAARMKDACNQIRADVK